MSWGAAGVLLLLAATGHVLFGPPAKTQDELDAEWRSRLRNHNPPYRGQPRPAPPQGSRGRL